MLQIHGSVVYDGNDKVLKLGYIFKVFTCVNDQCVVLLVKVTTSRVDVAYSQCTSNLKRGSASCRKTLSVKLDSNSTWSSARYRDAIGVRYCLKFMLNFFRNTT